MNIFYQILFKLLGAFFILISCNCGPISFLQFYHGKMISNSSTSNIEKGKKERHNELGFSYSSTLKADSTQFSQGSVYNFESDSDLVANNNVSIRFPSHQISLHAATIGEKLLCGQFDAQVATVDNQILYDASLGIGVRLYKGPLGVRVFFSTGISNVAADVYIFQKDGTEETDLLDTFHELRPFIGYSLSCNTIIPDWPINPFWDIKIRYHSLFNFNEISINLLSFFTTCGVYTNLGNSTPALGVQFSRYSYERSSEIHPTLVGHITFYPKKR